MLFVSPLSLPLFGLIVKAKTTFESFVSTPPQGKGCLVQVTAKTKSRITWVFPTPDCCNPKIKVEEPMCLPCGQLEAPETWTCV